MNKKKIFYGWFIVAGCVMIMALGYAPLVSCASLFIKPITEDLGIARSAYTLVNTISTLLGVFLAPLAGKLMSSRHMHKILITCIAGVSISYGMFSVATSLPVFYLIAVFVGVFAAGSTMIPISVVITNWFQKQRGLATSIAMAGSGIGGAILSPVIGRLITSYGWRHTYIVIAAVMFCVLVPVAVFIIRQKPADKGLQPYGYGEGASAKKTVAAAEWNVTLKELKGQPLFWAFIAGVTLISLTGAIISHIPSAVMDAGYSTAKAASITSIYMAIAVPGKLLLGHIFDKYGSKAGILFGNTAFFLSVTALLFISAEPMLYLMAVLFGFGTCIGTVSVSVLTSKLFGSKNYAETFGFVSMFSNAGFAFGVPLIAVVYDVTGTYKIAWILVAVLALLMTALLLYSAAQCRKHVEVSA